MNLKDTRILNKIKRGDVATFETLFHRYYPGMCSYAESLLEKAEVAEEIVQDVFLNVWKNRQDLSITVSWQSYLFRSVFNNSMMYLRKARREMSLDERWADTLAGSEDDITEEINAREMNAIIIFTLQSLPDKTREIFKLSRFEGLKYQQIANQMNISVKTVEANMGKALKALRISLEEFRKSA